MAAYRRVYDSRHLQADCHEPGSAAEPYAWQSSAGYLDIFTTYGAARCLTLRCGDGSNVKGLKAAFYLLAYLQDSHTTHLHSDTMILQRRHAGSCGIIPGVIRGRSGR